MIIFLSALIFVQWVFVIVFSLMKHFGILGDEAPSNRTLRMNMTPLYFILVAFVQMFKDD
jgi:hypothetical protein